MIAGGLLALIIILGTVGHKTGTTPHAATLISWLPSSVSGGSHSNVYGNGILSSEKGWMALEQMSLTRFRSHAPGFSVIQNLYVLDKDMYWRLLNSDRYYRNGTYIYLTDEPWAIPPEKYTVTYSTNGQHKIPKDYVGSQVYALRNPTLTPQSVKEHELFGISVTLDQAREMSESAIDLESPMVRDFVCLTL
jgi:hypothetical protein